MSERLTSLITLARFALAFLWIFTGITSIFMAPEIGYGVLARSGITDWYADVMVYGGSLVDIILGVWLLTSKHLRMCCVTQVVVIFVFTLLLTVIDNSFWFHPFGPLTKNIPILVLILIVYVQENEASK